MNKKERIGFRVGVAMAGVVALAGCGPRPVSTTATIHFETATSAEMTQAASVLQARFRALSPSFLSSLSTVVGENDIVLEFRGPAPPDETIRYYGTSQGSFRLYPLDAPRNWLLTDRDIENVRAVESEAGPALAMTVRESAAQKLLSYTSRNVGKVLVTSWDGNEQSRATVAGVFSQRFETTGMDRDTALRMQVILQSGRLPVAVREIEISHPAGGG